MELKSINDVKNARNLVFENIIKLLIGLAFIVLAVIYSTTIEIGFEGGKYMLAAAVFFGCYMALNIGANDVANNIGPAVGSKAVTIGWAIVIAAVFELSGALIAGSDVTETIKGGIVNSSITADDQVFIWIMMAALLGGALWLNVATYVGAPVSTTHAIVGGVVGAGIAAAGWEVVYWGSLAKIASSWVVSPILGGVIAAGMLYFIKRTILQVDDRQKAAQKIVPILMALMSFAFIVYLSMKGLKSLIKVDLVMALIVGAIVAVATYLVAKPLVKKTSERLPNSKRAINWLFNFPLIFAAAMLSFAHGANDVSNAIGPLAAIVEVLQQGVVGVKSGHIPFWIMFLGALGLSVGLILYGPKLVKTVGTGITELDQIRAFCIAMAAAITVIVASQLGLPVSSTHTAIGGIFGVGFLREWLMRNEFKKEVVRDPTQVHIETEQKKLEDYKNELESLGKLKNVDPLFIKELIKKINDEKRIISYITTEDLEVTKIEKKALKAVKKHEYVKRSALKMIVAAWVITVPVVGVLSAMFYFMLRGMML
ncbi:MAG: inorganic phosphate transporter [Campylobacteraceae bacterium]